MQCPRAFRAREMGGPLEPLTNIGDPQAPTLKPILTLPRAFTSTRHGARHIVGRSGLWGFWALTLPYVIGAGAPPKGPDAAAVGN